MQFNPHDYQRFAIDFIKGHPNAAVFLDMGLGKTVITLTALDDLLFDSFEVSRVLHDRKLDALEDLIEAANGKPVLVMYNYQHDLTRIQQRFGKYSPENPNGVRELKTSCDMEDWNAGKIPVAATQPASTGHGLNLQQGGNTIIWFGLNWSLELYEQANARLWRQGQKETVVVHHLVVKGTMDEQVMQALKDKAAGQDSLMAAVRARIKKTRPAIKSQEGINPK